MFPESSRRNSSKNRNGRAAIEQLQTAVLPGNRESPDNRHNWAAAGVCPCGSPRLATRTRKRSSQSRGCNRARADTVSFKTRLFPSRVLYCPPFTLTEGEYSPAEGMGALGFPRLRMLALNEW